MGALLLALGISVVAGAIGGALKGWAKNEEAKLETDALELELELDKRQNALGALNQASARTLEQETITQGIDDEISMYNMQAEQLSMQSAQNTGSAVAQSATTGFRNTGANTNVKSLQEQAGKFNSNYMSLQLQQQMTNQGLSRMGSQQQHSVALQGYKENIYASSKSINKQIQNLGYTDKYWAWDSKEMWISAGLGALDSSIKWVDSNSSVLAEEML